MASCKLGKVKECLPHRNVCYSSNAALERRHQLLVPVPVRDRHNDQSVHYNDEHDNGGTDDDDYHGRDHVHVDHHNDTRTNRVRSHLLYSIETKHSHFFQRQPRNCARFYSIETEIGGIRTFLHPSFIPAPAAYT